MSDLALLERKLHTCKVILWLKQQFELDEEALREDDADTDDVTLSKEVVYQAYLHMCREAGATPLFSRPVLGKMVRRAFPSVQSRRRGPRTNVKQHWVGLRLRPGADNLPTTVVATDPPEPSATTTSSGGGGGDLATMSISTSTTATSSSSSVVTPASSWFAELSSMPTMAHCAEEQPADLRRLELESVRTQPVFDHLRAFRPVGGAPTPSSSSSSSSSIDARPAAQLSSRDELELESVVDDPGQLFAWDEGSGPPPRPLERHYIDPPPQPAAAAAAEAESLRPDQQDELEEELRQLRSHLSHGPSTTQQPLEQQQPQPQQQSDYRHRHPMQPSSGPGPEGLDLLHAHVRLQRLPPPAAATTTSTSTTTTTTPPSSSFSSRNLVAGRSAPHRTEAAAATPTPTTTTTLATSESAERQTTVMCPQQKPVPPLGGITQPPPVPLARIPVDLDAPKRPRAPPSSSSLQRQRPPAPPSQ